MCTQRTILILIFSFCFLPPCLGKKKKIEHYWRPSKILTPRTLGSLATTSSDTLAIQRVVKSENQRIEKDPYLLQAVFHSSKQVAKAAILALGRVGDPNSVETLSRVLNGKNSDLKQIAAFSLGQIGDELAIRLLSQHVAMERKPDIRGAFYRAMGYSRQLAALSILVRALDTESDPSVIKNVAEGLGILLSGNSSSWIISEDTLKRLASLSESSSDLSTSAAFALSQYKGEPQKIPAISIMAAASKTTNPHTQVLLIRTLSRIDDPQVTTFLLSKLSSSSAVPIRIEAIKSLKGKKLNELALSVFQKALTDDHNNIVATSLETIDELPANFVSLTNTVLKLFKTSNSVWIKSSAIRSLGKLSPEQGRSIAIEALKSSEPILVSAALASLVSLNNTEDWNQIKPFFKQGSPQLISQSLESLANLKTEDTSDDLKATLKDLIGKKDPGVLALLAQLASQKKWKDFAQPLADTYSSLITEDTVETKVAIVTSLATIGSEDQISVISKALKDKSKQVIIAALDAAKTVSGQDVPFQTPLNSKVSDVIPDYSMWSTATSQRVVLKTNRGDIEIKFFDDSPITAYRFIDLIKNRFYNGKTFHRIVPNFVTQGGDPRGDGFGSAGFLLRDEFSPRNHERGTLGIATSGKDTGGCQFFFNLLPNFHLNGRYTAFAEVISGIEVVDRLELGDKIISASVK